MPQSAYSRALAAARAADDAMVRYDAFPALRQRFAQIATDAYALANTLAPKEPVPMTPPLPPIGSVVTLVIFGHGLRAVVHSHTSDTSFTIYQPPTVPQYGEFSTRQLLQAGKTVKIAADWTDCESVPK